ncbi:MAG TPA: metallopeptidase family protein [Streptosporangiaceae bacterium]|nr:metallopeptidase family protein [Streptosporangiaceae bacterium]
MQTGDGGSRPGSGSGPNPGSGPGPGAGPGSGARPRRRDRHGRGLRGPLAPPGVPLYRTRSQQFDDLVLEAVARLEPRWETELSDVEFAVQEVPDADIMEGDGVPLARVIRGSADTGDPDHPAAGPRIVLFRRPLLARAEDEDELSELLYDVVVEEFAEILGVDPEVIDPTFGDLG